MVEVGYEWFFLLVVVVVLVFVDVVGMDME